MKQDVVENDALAYTPCRYGRSRIMFRGPEQSLDNPYIAFFGGTETYGKFVIDPFPARIGGRIDKTCVNLGCVNGGIDAFVKDPSLPDICRDAYATVMQVMGANYLSNRFYVVHPRRNDRFIQASTTLQGLYPEVDFTQFTFVRHMLGALYEACPERFEAVVAEVRAAWSARMRTILGRIGQRTVLLWFSPHAPSDAPWAGYDDPLQVDPLFVTRQMLEALRPLVQDIVIVTPSLQAMGQGGLGMSFPENQAGVAATMLNGACHDEAAAALLPVLEAMPPVPQRVEPEGMRGQPW